MKIADIRRKNLKNWIDKYHDGSQASFIEKTNTNQGELSAIINGHKAFGEKKARSFEDLAGMPALFLDNSDTLDEAPQIKGMVPVISWVAAGAWCNIEMLPQDEALRWLPCPVNHSKNTYALKVTGISMRNPNGKPTFDEDDIIFVDPEKCPEHKSLVVVRLDDEEKATFKQLIIEHGYKYLQPLNPNWPEQIIEVDDSATICGVVIGKWVDM